MNQATRNQLASSLSKRAGIAVTVISFAVAIAADQLLPGWGRCIGTTVGVFCCAAVMWPQFRRKLWFWATLVLLAALQIVAMIKIIGLRTWLEEVNPFLWFVLFLLDFVFVATAVVLIGSAALKETLE